MPPDEPGKPIHWHTGTIDTVTEHPSTRTRTTVAPPPNPPPSNPRLRDEGQIAKGGMGSIHVVHDSVIDRLAAMKVLEVRDNDDARVRFIREAQITGQLDHPNIVPVYDIGTLEDGSLCFTMKLVRGRTLAEVLRQWRNPSTRELEDLLHILIKVCDAVSFAHHRGVIHRDLKPENIMIGSHGQVYVMDWGCAYVLDDHELALVPDVDARERVRCPKVPELEEPGTIVGTGPYMPPEQADGRTDEIDGRNDVFSLGAILYEVLAGWPPFRGANRAAAIQLAREAVIEPIPASRRAPRSLCRIAMRSLARDREERYPSVDALKDDLEQALRAGNWFASATYAPGEVIVREGEVGAGAFIITAGKCLVTRLEDGRQVPLRRLGAGEVFGETALLTNEMRSATVTAETDAEVVVVTREALYHDLAIDTWTGAFVRALAERFRELDENLSRQRRMQRALLRQRIEQDLAAAGIREASWSPMAARLRADLGLGDTEILAILTGDPDIVIDVVGDVVSVRR